MEGLLLYTQVSLFLAHLFFLSILEAYGAMVDCILFLSFFLFVCDLWFLVLVFGFGFCLTVFFGYGSMLALNCM